MCKVAMVGLWMLTYSQNYSKTMTKNFWAK